jgi:DNA-binding IclR family transcriptional regulator
MPAQRQGIQSVEIGVRLLRALADAPGAVSLKALALAAGMPASKAHRYLVSFGRAGLVAQDAESGRYDLGPLALTLGLAALGRLNVARVGAWAAGTLRDRIDETVLIAVWGERGPVVIGWEESSKPVTVNVRIGSIMPLLTSATGRVFLGCLPDERTAAFVSAELAGPRLRGLVRPDPARLIAEVRRHGLGRVDGDMLPGVGALAAPVRDHEGKLAFVLTALGPQGVFDSRWDGATAKVLREVAAAASLRLGGVAG